MASCEKCWGDAYMRTYSDPTKMQSEHYQDLIKERKHNECTPEQQAGNDAKKCPKCERLTIHQIIGWCTNCGYDEKNQTKIMETIKMKFKDAPVGARLIYPNSKSVWVKINSYPESQFNDGNGLIVEWNGNVQGHQSYCSFVDKENGIDFETEVELVPDAE